ncbi:MAG TPA: SAM-dependent methyltransferase, partial [Deltaproteobacteria bacterium]|nr:SAM-dependent methyltransferase [Deltaproteobacteria bacterium]
MRSAPPTHQTARKALCDATRSLRSDLLSTLPPSQAGVAAAERLILRLAVLQYIEACGLSAQAHQRLGTAGRSRLEILSLLGEPPPKPSIALAHMLPGLFGPDPVLDSLSVSSQTLRHALNAFEHPTLRDCWADDLTPGWVFQFLNDPARERLDEKINQGGKIGLHEVARKTQMFTERYLIHRTLHNSLGPLWLAICARNDWTADVVASGTLDHLAVRRSEWRTQRAAGRISSTALMPLHTPLEHAWSDFIPPPGIRDPDPSTPTSIRALKLIDPAVGTGHFLIVAFDLLLALHEEEARHRGRTGVSPWTPRDIVERILSHNLHGIDLDPSAVQMAATMLWLKALQVAPDAEPTRMNLVATDHKTLHLPDPNTHSAAPTSNVVAATHRRSEAPGIAHALAQAANLGSLVQVDALATQPLPEDAFSGPVDDLGVRLRGDQPRATPRLLSLLRSGQYDLVVTNPPYQGTKRLEHSDVIVEQYPEGSADLYAAFLLRGLQLARVGGISAQLTMRSWLFTKQFSRLRERLLTHHQLLALGDFEHGAFEQLGGMVVSVCASVFRRDRPPTTAIALRPSPPSISKGVSRTAAKRAAIRCQTGLHTFHPTRLQAIPEWPLVYWWSDETLERYAQSPKLADAYEVRQGMATGDNHRFLRRPWELSRRELWYVPVDSSALPSTDTQWVPYVKGAAGKTWFEPLDHVVRWGLGALEIKTHTRNGRQASRPQNERFYFRPGVCYSTIGARFSARLRRYRSVF